MMVEDVELVEGDTPDLHCSAERNDVVVGVHFEIIRSSLDHGRKRVVTEFPGDLLSNHFWM